VFPYPGGGCLSCGGWISANQLQQEALSSAEREAQRYVDDPDVHEPSVITLNAIGTALAANDLMMSVTSLFPGSVDFGHQLYDAEQRELASMGASHRPSCRECGTTEQSRFGRGDRGRLPCRAS
jgi:hypothetical protein